MKTIILVILSQLIRAKSSHNPVNLWNVTLASASEPAAAFVSVVQQAKLCTLQTVDPQVMVDLSKLWLEWLFDDTASVHGQP